MNPVDAANPNAGNVNLPIDQQQGQVPGLLNVNAGLPGIAPTPAWQFPQMFQMPTSPILSDADYMARYFNLPLTYGYGANRFLLDAPTTLPPVYIPPPEYLPPPPPVAPPPPPPPPAAPPPAGGEPPPPLPPEIQLPELPPIEPVLPPEEPALPPIEDIPIPVVTQPPIKEIETLPPPEPIEPIKEVETLPPPEPIEPIKEVENIPPPEPMTPIKEIELPPIPVEIPPPDEVLPFRPFEPGEIQIPIIEEPKLKKPAVEGKIVGGAEWEDPENRPGETFKEYESKPPEETPVEPPPPGIPIDDEFMVGADIVKDYFGPGMTDGPDLYGRPVLDEPGIGGDIIKGYQGPGIEDIPGVYAEPMIGAETGGAYLPQAPVRSLPAEVAPAAVPEVDVEYSYTPQYETPAGDAYYGPTQSTYGGEIVGMGNEFVGPVEQTPGLLETAPAQQPATAGLLDAPITEEVAQAIMANPELLQALIGDELGKFGQLTGKAGTYISPEDEFYYRGEA